jgi:hypothetical protein
MLAGTAILTIGLRGSACLRKMYVPLALLPKPARDNEGYAIMLLKEYDDRNTAAVNYFERIGNDSATAAELKKHTDEARALGESIRKNLLVANPAEGARVTFEKYIVLQCMIAHKAENALNRSAQWTKASYWRDSYNRAAQNEMSAYERIFGSKRLIVRDCGPQ